MNSLKSTKGAAQLIFIIFFLFASVALVFSLSRGVYASLATVALLADSKQSYRVALASNEDIMYRWRQAMEYDGTRTLALGGTSAVTTVVEDVFTETMVVTTESTQQGAVRISELELELDNGLGFSAGIHSGEGGFVLNNSASVRGSLFSNGQIIKPSGPRAMIYGDIISSGPSGLVDNIHATGTVWANRIVDSRVDIDAYATTLTNTDVYGTAFYTVDGGSNDLYGADNGPGTVVPDQDPIPFPITDDIIEAWEDEAAAGGVIASTDSRCSGGTYVAPNANLTLGPIKIECNFTFDRNRTLTISGPVWVEGNVTIDKANVQIDFGDPDYTYQIIADVRGDREDSGIISIGGSANFLGSTAASYVMLISMNTSASVGGGIVAIEGGQSSNGKLIMYAPHGAVDLANNGNLNQITAHTIILSNSMEVLYEDGLANPLFTSGPPKGLSISSWREVE